MLAISLLQPWAWAILHAGKGIENRTWDLPQQFVGRRIFLHASKNVTRRDYGDAVDTIGLLAPSVEVPSYADIPKGALVGAVTFTGSIAPSDGIPLERWHFPEQFGWLVHEPRALPEPIPCKGALGFWRVSESIADRIRELAGGAP